MRKIWILAILAVLALFLVGCAQQAGRAPSTGLRTQYDSALQQQRTPYAQTSPYATTAQYRPTTTTTQYIPPTPTPAPAQPIGYHPEEWEVEIYPEPIDISYKPPTGTAPTQQYAALTQQISALQQQNAALRAQISATQQKPITPTSKIQKQRITSVNTDQGPQNINTKLEVGDIIIDADGTWWIVTKAT